MQTAKLLNNHGTQAVCLPKDCRFSGTDVYVKKSDDIVLFMSKHDPWAALINSLDYFTDDFMESRNQADIESRESL
jgi:antitoxin VapB